jgi:hypothetical protein
MGRVFFLNLLKNKGWGGGIPNCWAIRLNLETCKLGSAEDKYMLVSYTTDYWFS